MNLARINLNTWYLYHTNGCSSQEITNPLWCIPHMQFLLLWGSQPIEQLEEAFCFYCVSCSFFQRHPIWVAAIIVSWKTCVLHFPAFIIFTAFRRCALLVDDTSCLKFMMRFLFLSKPYCRLQISWISSNFNNLLQVTWIRHRDLHLLTVNRFTYTSDQRFSAIHNPMTEDWTLQIRYPQPRDSGIYECQVGTTPPIGHSVWMSVVGRFSFFCFLYSGLHL